MVKRLFITVKGRVQGVGFRAYTVNSALKYGITGYCANLENGCVFIDAQGEEHNINMFLSDVKKGPKFSIVDDVILESQETLADYSDFNIRY
ncbi:MAG: acylphosphatase [Calditerrivibrio sp.]|nr:acylphosphatase [Calditerrivibrio sp.]MCA1932185.1 acylphosphatase [Calditerrivibrio sp.]MCA1980383.1 acylphosphatase [Calditerrivibrio sp.]